MYKLKAVVRRGALLSTAAIVAAAAYLPAPSAFADALNPLTDRSLTLSSSSPGWDYKDGSGNTTYAVPGSGANGQKTANTFDFKVSTDTTGLDKVEAMTFQYCTTSAGSCLAPGDNGWTGSAPSATRNADTAGTSDLNVVVSSPAEVGSSDFATLVTDTAAATNPDGKIAQTPQGGISFNSYYSKDNGGVTYPQNAVAGNFMVYYLSAGTWTQSSGWAMTVKNKETGTAAQATATGKNNFITLANATGQGFASGTRVKVVFFATDTNYITNPGSGAFFVKINTYKDVDLTAPATPVIDEADLVDGGVTVANVMNHSISIQTKVLETMQFSVGTVDPYTLDSTGGATGGDENDGSPLYKANGKTAHGGCDRILTGMTPSEPVNVLRLGDKLGEDSLATDITYSTHSYWRLSSNSSAGATVYYSGVTLSNTVGDKIDPIGPTKKAPLTGTEQFGLAIGNGKTGDYEVDYNTESAPGKEYENGADFGIPGLHTASILADLQADPGPPIVYNSGYHSPRLAPLVAHANYSDGAGTVNTNYSSGSDPITTAFAFDPVSNLIPVPIASQNTQVVDCVTAKMRYIANIAATTPAGIYTTKINYIAAPQY